MQLGQIGIWKIHREGVDAVAEIEALGYSALWLGGSPSIEEARPFLAASSTLTVATGILNVWRHEPADVAREHAEVQDGRFLLGIGIGHPEATSEYRTPMATMRAFLDGLDGADPPVPREQRAMAALGPKMLDLAAQRSLGAHSYFVPVEHTRIARQRIGPDALLSPEVAVVVEPDPQAAHEIARAYAAGYLRRSNYTRNLLRLGFAETDLADGGSDRLIDAIIPHGAAEQIADAVRAHLDAGADHVCLQPLGHGPSPIADYRALAEALL